MVNLTKKQEVAQIEQPIEIDTWVKLIPPHNIVLQMGENEGIVRLQFPARRTPWNRLRYAMLCWFFPFKIVEWK